MSTNEAALGCLPEPHGAITIRLALLQNTYYAPLIPSNINFIRHSFCFVTRCTVREILLRAFCVPVRNVTIYIPLLAAIATIMRTLSD